jgi:F0F1-type ATP synthase membrane subunit c/vacuolar-type H+-ATPase subunit K
MPKRLVAVLSLLPAAGAGAAGLLLTSASSSANTVARTPTISGNGWVALLIIAAFVGTIYMLIAGALHVERRDARLGRGKRTDDGWFGIFPAQAPDEEDSPDYQHYGGGDGGEGGGEGGF